MKVSLTLPDDWAGQVGALVAAGQADSVSAFVRHAVGVSLHDAAEWQETLEDALRQTGGPLTRKERAWAGAILAPRKKAKRSK